MPAMEGQLKKRGAKMPVMHDRYCVATWEINHSTFDKYVLLRSFKTQKGYAEQPAKPSSACTLKSVSDWSGKTSFHHYDHAFQMESTDGQVYFCVAPTALEKAQWVDFMTSGRSYRSSSNTDLRQLGRTSSNAELHRLVRTSSNVSTGSNAELRQLVRTGSHAELRQLVRTSSNLSTSSNNNGSSRSNVPFMDQVWRGPGYRKHSSSGLVMARKESDVSTDGELSMDEDIESCESFNADSTDGIGDAVNVAEDSNNQVEEASQLIESAARATESGDGRADAAALQAAPSASGALFCGEYSSVDGGDAAVTVTHASNRVWLANASASSESSGIEAGATPPTPDPGLKTSVHSAKVKSSTPPPAASDKGTASATLKRVVERPNASNQRALDRAPTVISIRSSVSPTVVEEEPAIEAGPELSTPEGGPAIEACPEPSSPAAVEEEPATQSSAPVTKSPAAVTLSPIEAGPEPSSPVVVDLTATLAASPGDTFTTSDRAPESIFPIPTPVQEGVDAVASCASAVEKPENVLSRPSSQLRAATPAPQLRDVISIEQTSQDRSTSAAASDEPSSRARSTSLPATAPSRLSGRKLARIGSASAMSAIDEDSADESDEAWFSLATRARARSSVMPRAHETFPSLTRERLRRHSFGSAYQPPTRAAQVFARSSSVKPTFIEPRLGYVHSGLSTILPSFATLFTSLSRQQSLADDRSKASKADNAAVPGSSMDLDEV